MTKEQLLALAKSFPQRWCVEKYSIARCFVAPLEGHEPVVVVSRYGRICPVQGTKTYDTKEEAQAALAEKRELRRKQEAAAIEVVGKYIRRVGFDFKRAAQKDKNLKDLLDTAAEYADRRRTEYNQSRIELLSRFIRTGTINMSGLSFRKEDVALVRYGQAKVYWRSETTPIQLTLRSGEKVITRTSYESSFIQDIFGANASERIWPDVKWPTDSRIDE